MDDAFRSGFASALLDVLFSKAAGIMIVELKKVLGCDTALDNLETTILVAHDLLKKLDTSEMEGNTKIVAEKRVFDLLRLFFDTEDLMGDIVALTNRYSDSCDKPVRKAILKSLGSWTKPRKIAAFQKKLDEILTQLKTLEELTREPEYKKAEPSYRKQRYSPITLVGRKDDEQQIMGYLLSGSSDFDGVSILGMSGLGKTSLAKIIHKDAKSTSGITDRLWVDVPDGCFDFEDIINKLNGLSATKPPSDSCLLITFDNLLKVTLDDWCSMLREILGNVDNQKGYTRVRFLITTFCPDVVQITRTRSHYLTQLREEDCEKVILDTTKSMKRDLSDSPSLNEVVKDLAKSSGGLPLVACRLGQFLGQFGVEYVRNIIKTDMWDSDDFKKYIFPALKPWYLEFKSHLKRYLAYFSLFPHDCHYAFSVDDLVHLWVGEGFIQHPEGTSKMIEIGKKHFDVLLGLSIFRHFPKTSSAMQTYELNQFSYKFAQLAASRTCLRLAEDMRVSDINTRHLSLCYKNVCSPNWKDIKKLKVLRTFFILSEKSIGVIPIDAFNKLIRLRVLSLSGSDVRELPNSIEKLLRLRYLNVSNTPMETLPATLCKLTTLQFLKLTKGVKGRLRRFPPEFEKLTNLIHVDWGINDIRVLGLPPNIGKLSSLQTLPLFPVMKKDGHRISELKDMNHLQGSICIDNLENVDDCDDAMLHEKSFTQIQLEWKKATSCEIAEKVLSSLKPGENLNELKIINYNGKTYPDWMTSSLPRLEEIHLSKCPSLVVLPKLGLLPSLKLLVLKEISNVTSMDHDFFGQGNFPNLRSLEIELINQLQEWNMGQDLTAMPQLKDLTIKSCSLLANVSSLVHLSSLENLIIQRCAAMSPLPELPISLKKLEIIESDSLIDRCKDNHGDDWTKFDHVSEVQIGWNVIRSP